MKYSFFISSLFVVMANLCYPQNSPDYFKVFPKLEGDEPAWVKLMYSSDPIVEEVISSYQKFYSNHSFVKNLHTQNYKHWIENVQDKVKSDGTIGDPYSRSYREKIENLRNQKLLFNKGKSNIWKPVGPYVTYSNDGSLQTRPNQVNVSCMDVAPSNHNILYCFTTGGIFKSVDRGLNWTLKSLNESFTGGADLKIHPKNPDVVFAASGRDIYKTEDGGTIWKLVHTANGTVEQLYIHKDQPDKVYAATRSGLLQTTDKGKSWTNLFNKSCWDIVAHPTKANVLYLSVNNSSLVRSEIYKSIDGGMNWELKDNKWYKPSDPSNAKDQGCKIGVTPADPDRVYACLIGSSKAGDNGWIGVYYSLNGGDTWVNANGMDGGPYESGKDKNTNWFVAGYGSGYQQGWYNFDMNVSHKDPDKIWIGTIWACESENRGKNIEYIRKTRKLQMHADIQDIEVVGDEVWFTSDGGINYSKDEMKTVETRNSGIHASNFWGFGHGWNEDTWTGGRYHNGNTVYHENYNKGNTVFQGGAERATGHINPYNNKRCYYSDVKDRLTPNSLTTPSQKPKNNISIYPNEAYGVLGSSEIEYDPSYANHMFLGRDNILYKSLDGGLNFSPLHTFDEDGRVLEFEISRKNPKIIYCLVLINSKGGIYKSTDGGNSFSPTTDLPSNNISKLDLSLDPENPDHLWVISHNGANGKKVYRTLDGGKTWENKTTEILNDHKIHDIAYQGGTDDVVYLATDYGFFYWQADKKDWIPYSEGLPFVNQPRKMVMFYRDSKIRMASKRGVWEAPMIVKSKPIAQPFVEQSKVYCKDTVQFEDYSILDHDGASWEWSFSPNAIFVDNRFARNPKVLFGEKRSYDVTLTVTDKNGNTDTKTVKNMVTMDNQCVLPEPIPGRSMKVSNNGGYAETENFNINQTRNLTISAWIKPQGKQDENTGIVINNGTAAGLNFTSDNELGYHWPGGNETWKSGLIVKENKWSHVALVITPSSVTIYLNGVSSTHNVDLSSVNLSKLSIGRFQNIANRTFNGEIDEVCIWKRSFSQNEIRLTRHLTRTGVRSYFDDLVGYYQFNETQSDVVYNKAGNNHAALIGGAERNVSTIPVGGGVSERETISQSGTYNLEQVGLALDFATTIPNGEIVVSRIHLTPDSIPFKFKHTDNYWVVNNYGEQNFSTLNEMKFTSSSGKVFGLPHQMKLFTRDENEDRNNWDEKCSATDLIGGSFNYNQSCGIKQFSQFFIQADEFVTDIHELDDDNQINVFPNPVSEILSVIRSESKGLGLEFKLFDATNRVVRQAVMGPNELNLQINMRNLPAGAYFLHTIVNREPKVKKIIKLQ